MTQAALPDAPPALNLDQVRIDPLVALRVPAALALRRQVLAFAADDACVHVACLDPDDAAALDAVERHTGLQATPRRADPDALHRALQRVYADKGGLSRYSQLALRAGSPDGRVSVDLEPDDAVALCDELLHAAVICQASDIHLDPLRIGLRVRLRVDGVLEEHRRLPASCTAAVISRFKVLAGLDIAEKRAPQDGGFTHRYGHGSAGREVDVRVATLPTRHGERMTLRLLALQAESLTLEHLGMLPADLARVQAMLDQPHGMLLLTGPTGSGKSTTLYAAIRRLIAAAEYNVVTIEDPVEYDIPGVAQVEVDSADKVSFAKALRSVLRHDPDVVMIGEIRDAATLDVAVKASLTGHLVLSTLHTNSAVSAVTRLADLGLERYLIAAALRLAVAQRLVRRLCPHCRRPTPLSEPHAVLLGRPDLTGRQVWGPGGCIYCGQSGYAGRVGVFETVPVTAALGEQIVAGANERTLQALAEQAGVTSLRADAVAKVLAGVTSPAEAVQIVAGA